MTNAWQTYQMRLALWLTQQPMAVPTWSPARRVARSRCQPTPPARDGRGESFPQLVRLPGVWRPECSPLLVRVQ